ncbi:MAG: M48 family metalloprotease [Acidobacteria bacterium]|nr:M48 family metalloprotease [Acidobacteriota bacterium]
MKKINLGRNFAALVLAWTMLMLPLAAIGQTRISIPKNKYSIQDEIKIGQQVSREVEQQMPILNDSEATRYVQDVGRRLVNAIPSQFQHPGFRYQFKIVNASDINAFALPGGYMYVNRGMIEAARSEGEMAGVMAHELSHVALRHGTAQATEQSKPLNQILGIGAVLGGAILGGQTGAQLGQIFAQGYFTRFSRKYETQADTLGAQIMARAGYDPHDLANMFRTIERQSGGNRAPEFLSSHPNPANRYENINREAQLLRVSPNAIQNTRQFELVQSRLARMPRAQSMAQIEQNAQRNPQGRTNPTTNGRYENRVELPSSQTRSYTGGNFLRVSVPNNWQVFETQDSVTFAPQGAYGNNGITHGALVGVTQTRSRDLGQATQEYVNSLLQNQSNSYLRQQSNFSRTSIDGRNAYATVLSGRSPITGRTEVVNLYTTQLSNGSLLYIAMVAPQDVSSRYNNAFRNLIRSAQINDR